MADLNLLNKDVDSTLHTAGDKLGTYYLADNPKYFEPQRKNTFEFYVTGLNAKLKDQIPTNLYAENNAEDVLKLSVKSSSIPHFTVTKSSISRGNNQMHFAGKAEFDDGSITIHDYIGAGSKDILLAWQRQAYDPETEKVGLASDYKMDAYLLEYTPEYQLVRSWVLRGCWISKINEDAYDHESSDLKTVDATIIYDKAYLDKSIV